MRELEDERIRSESAPVDLSSTEEKDTRMTMLKAKYKHVRRGTETIEPNDFHLYFITDNKPKNQGRCFYNYNVDTYYVGVRKWKNNHAFTILEIERENINTGHTMITFHISGKIQINNNIQ